MAHQSPTSPEGSFDANNAGDHMGHFSNADYDWMGVLDGCFGHSAEHYAHDDAAAGGDGHDGDSSSSNLMSAHPSSTTVPEASEQYSLKNAEEEEEGEDGKPSPRETSVTSTNNDDEDGKKSDRVERKRNREKQRRLDTNSQFTALAAIVREIETTDFIEEAQFHSSYETQDKIAEDGAEAEGKRLKSDSDYAGGSLQSAIAAAGTYSASNRVELIARTTLMLSQFRAIRKLRNEELRDVRRQNCEMSKEIEDLRRMVAHYKTMGMGQHKPQDKIMMMVPMMVPHDAVNSVSTGFPAAHPCVGSFAAPWMPSPSFAHVMPSYVNTQHFHQPPTQGAQSATTAPFAQLPDNQNANHPAFTFNMQQGTGQSPGVAALPQHNIMQAQGFPFQVPGHTANSNTGHDSNSPAMSHAPQQFAQLSAPAQMLPSSTQGMMQPQAAFHHLNHAMGTMFPHPITGVAAPAGLNPNSHNHADTSVTQQTPTLGTQQPSSDKPSPSAHQGGGGNLAHCA